MTPSQYLPRFLALGAYCAGLLAWRYSYPNPDLATFGLVILCALAFAAIYGGYKTALQRRRALLSAAIEDGSGLKRLLKGHATAVFASLVSIVVFLPALAYHLLLGHTGELLLSLALGLIVAIVFRGSGRSLCRTCPPALSHQPRGTRRHRHGGADLCRAASLVCPRHDSRPGIS